MSNLRFFILLIFVVILKAGNGQDLISRTIEGLSCQSTLQPNELSKDFDNQKAHGAISLFDWDSRKSNNEMDQVNMKMDRTAFSQLQKGIDGTIKIIIPVSEAKSFNIMLKEVDVISQDGNLLTQEGIVKSLNNMKFYRGIIEGDHGSLVSMSIINDDIRIAIYDQDGVYRVSPNNYKSNHYVIWKDQASQEKEFSCGTTDIHNLGSTVLKPVENNKAAGDVVQVYVECDYELYLDKGGVSGVEAFVASLFTEINTLYANENIAMEVSDIFTWTTADPYRGNNDIESVLTAFGENKKNNYNGRIATLLKGDDQNTCSVSGIAWVDVLCNVYEPSQHSGPYNATQGIGICPLNPNPTTMLDAIDVAIVAHEIGHNIASPHTHNCSWGSSQNKAIDNCPGYTEGGCGLIQNPTPPSEINTIMSYCGSAITFSQGFGTEPGDLLRNRVSAATCLVSGDPNCTEENLSYNNTTVNSTTEYSNTNITLYNAVNIANNATVFWQAEDQFIINGTLTVPTNTILDIVADNCQ